MKPEDLSTYVERLRGRELIEASNEIAMKLMKKGIKHVRLWLTGNLEYFKRVYSGASCFFEAFRPKLENNGATLVFSHFDRDFVNAHLNTYYPGTSIEKKENAVIAFRKLYKVSNGVFSILVSENELKYLLKQGFEVLSISYHRFDEESLRKPLIEVGVGENYFNIGDFGSVSGEHFAHVHPEPSYPSISDFLYVIERKQREHLVIYPGGAWLIKFNRGLSLYPAVVEFKSSSYNKLDVED